jgi:PAS domain S-box-containing protein
MGSDRDEPIHVLHVDDDPAFLDLVSRFLERTDEGITVVSVDDAAAALDRLEGDDRIECVLSDYEMPGMDGLEFLSCVRDRCPRLPFILYTGRGDEATATEAITRGVSDYVQKDVDATHYLKLGVRIRREVERARAEREKETRLAALEAAHEGICIVGARGRINYANEAYLDLYGYERAELLGERWQRLHPDEEVDLITHEVLPHVEEHGEWSGESVGRRSDDTTFRESKSVTALPDGGLVIVARAYRTTAVEA